MFILLEWNKLIHGCDLMTFTVSVASSQTLIFFTLPGDFTVYLTSIHMLFFSDFHSSASLTVSPDRAQHFTSDSVSLSCEGNSTEWRVRRSPENRYLSDCSTWGTMTGSTCKLNTYRLSDAVYWCESGSGEFSNAVNITIQSMISLHLFFFPI